MARKKGGFAKALAIWLAFTSFLVGVILGFSIISGQLSLAGTFLGFIHPNVLLAVGWTMVVVGLVGLISLIIGLVQRAL